jgi:signal transduction histidine kinase
MYQPATVPENSTARILIVDDETAQMKALCDTLQDQGFVTAGFTNGESALAKLQETKFDLLLADLMMPGMDGITLLKAALETDPDIVGIIMTGEGTIATAVEAMKTGALDYILKPFKLSVILAVLSRALKVQKLRLENIRLERQVRERTAELESANKELQAFSYSVSHDLRAPLRAINGFSQIMLEDYSSQIPAEGQQMLSHVVEGARQMERLIEDLLRFSQMGRQSLRKEVVSVSALVEKVLKELNKVEDERNLEIKIGNLPDCFGDLSLLNQVFVNLLSNALKYTRQKEKATVEIGCCQQDGEIIYYVRDNGAGFDMRYADKLFGVFQRLHSADEFEGTGVGLSIVERIIGRHGGRIWAEAEVGKGAAFYFTLP